MTTPIAPTKLISELEVVSKVKDVSVTQKNPDRLKVTKIRVLIEVADHPPIDMELLPDNEHELLYTLYAKREVAKDGESLVPTGQIDHEFGFYRRRK